MIIDNLDIFGIAAAKTKDQPPRAVDCHRPLSLSVAGQRMQPHRLKGRNIVQRLRRMQQLQPRHRLAGVPPRKFRFTLQREALGRAIGAANDRSEEHTTELTSLMTISYA